MLDTIRGLNCVRNIARDCSNPRSLWCGGFFFEVETAGCTNPVKYVDHICDGLIATPAFESTFPAEHPSPRGPDVLCAGREFVYRLHHGSGIEGHEGPRIFAYRAKNTASALFLADLLDHIAVTRGQVEADFTSFVDVAELELIETRIL